MKYVNDVLDALQRVDPLVWATIGAYFAPYGQELLKRVRTFSESQNYIIALLVIPTTVAFLSGLVDSPALDSLHPLLKTVILAGVAAIVSQLRYGISLKPKWDDKKELAALKSTENF